jgi:RNA polymerase sigma factor (sigma-70 family)
MAVIEAANPVRQLRVMPLGTLSDERLAELAGIGHSDAFGTLYERYRDALARYCRSIVRDPEDAGDALQNTMVSVLRALQVRGPNGPLRPWLYRIAHNESVSILRRRHPHEELSPETPDRVDTELASLAKFRVESLMSDLGTLPENQRGALVMRELGGLEYDEIGNALEISAVSARKHVFEARVALNDIAAGRDANCADIVRRISDGDGRVLRARSIRGHLRGCPSCAAFERGMRTRSGTFALLPGVPVVSAGALLTAVLHGGGAVSSSGFGSSGSLVGGSVAGGSVAGGAMAAGSLLGGGSFAALKGLVAAGAIAVAGAGVIVGTGINSHAYKPAHVAVVTHAARTHRLHFASAPARRALQPVRVKLLPPPRLPAVHAYSVSAVRAVASTPPVRAVTSPPPVQTTSPSAPNTEAPTTSVPVTPTTPTTSTTPTAPPATATTASTPTGAPASGTGPSPSTASTNWIDAIIQNALQFAGVNVAAAEAQAAQSLTVAGAAPGTPTATSLVQGIISTFLGGH